ncbi:hypothetical protein, partial [Rhizobium leguminosarum]|uniref:hypothetical protein n=1 Tax=Rhizobium leguminosarum TaxID=384 RepID=UPI003F98DF11
PEGPGEKQAGQAADLLADQPEKTGYPVKHRRLLSGEANIWTLPPRCIPHMRSMGRAQHEPFDFSE